MNWLYIKVVFDGKLSIYFVFMDGYLWLENYNLIYYLWYEGGCFFDVGGKVIGDIK